MFFYACMSVFASVFFIHFTCTYIFCMYVCVIYTMLKCLEIDIRDWLEKYLTKLKAVKLRYVVNSWSHWLLALATFFIDADYLVRVHVIIAISDWRLQVNWHGFRLSDADALTFYIPFGLGFQLSFRYIFPLCLFEPCSQCLVFHIIITATSYQLLCLSFGYIYPIVFVWCDKLS